MEAYRNYFRTITVPLSVFSRHTDWPSFIPLKLSNDEARNFILPRIITKVLNKLWSTDTANIS